jgi:hypothetical protein
MKKSLAVSIILLPFYSNASDFENLKNKIDARLDATQFQTKQLLKKESIHVQVPWNFIDQRSANFWVSTIKAYDLLMKNSQKERYNFLYEASRAQSYSYPENINALYEWIKQEDKRVYALGLTHQFYQQWKPLVAEIKKAITDLNTERPQIEVKSDARGILLENKNFLESFQKDLVKIEKSMTDSNQKIENLKRDNESSSKSDSNSPATLVWSTLALIIGFFTARLLNRNQKTDNKVQAIVTPPLNQYQETNLQDAFKATLQDNSHLIDMANLNVLPYTTSSFNNSLNVSDEKISDGLQYFLKGTLALANGQNKKVSHIDWNCLEKTGRVFLEVNLHGVETDQKSLYASALIDGTGSAPAHFGRTEQLLSGSLPVVSLRTASNKTTVTLSLEGNSPVTAH